MRGRIARAKAMLARRLQEYQAIMQRIQAVM